MSGLLLHRSSSFIPAAVASAGVPIAAPRPRLARGQKGKALTGRTQVASIVQFKDRFRWRTLSIPEAMLREPCEII